MTAYSPPHARDRRENPHHVSAMQRLFMIWFLTALGVLFAASIALYLFTWLQQPVWPPPGSPALPMSTLAVGTVLIVASSFTMLAAVRAARGDRRAALTRNLVLTLLLGLGFLAVQGYNWAELAAAHAEREGTLLSVLFYALTVIHAAHVVGGLVPMGVVLQKSRRGTYTAQHHDGVRLLGWYWHFLDVVWLVLLGVIVVSYGV